MFVSAAEALWGMLLQVGWGGNVSILTRSPERWSNHLIVNTCEGKKLEAELSQISANAEEVIPKADLVLFCLPGFANESELRKIQPYLRKDTYVGTVFASSGFSSRLWKFFLRPSLFSDSNVFHL